MLQKLSKREKVLLMFLLSIIFIVVFFKFVTIPLENKIEELEIVNVSKQNELNTINSLVKKEPFFEKNVEDYRKKLVDLSETYYTKINQEDYLVLLTSINKDDSLKIDSFSFSDNSERYDNKDQIIVDFEFEGLYSELYSYLDEISNNKKDIYVSELKIETESDDFVSGTMAVNFDTIPALNQEYYEKSYFDEFGNLITRQSESPYSRYDSLAKKYDEKNKVSDDEMSKIELYLKDRVVKPVMGFDNSDIFFVGSDVDIIGDITKTEKRLYGSDAIEFSYNFGMKKPENKANLAFEDKLMINEQSKYLSLWVYSNEVTGHQIGVVLIDSIGESYDLVLTSNVDFKEWKALEVEIPIEVNYPCKVQRIYTENTDYDQRLNGTLIFDQLQTADVKELD